MMEPGESDLARLFHFGSAPALAASFARTRPRPFPKAVTMPRIVRTSCDDKAALPNMTRRLRTMEGRFSGGWKKPAASSSVSSCS